MCVSRRGDERGLGAEEEEEEDACDKSRQIVVIWSRQIATVRERRVKVECAL